MLQNQLGYSGYGPSYIMHVCLMFPVHILFYKSKVVQRQKGSLTSLTPLLKRGDTFTGSEPDRRMYNNTIFKIYTRSRI